MPDSPEMVAFVTEVHTALSSSCPELMGNMDEMWRRQMRDDRLLSLHPSQHQQLDRSEANAIIQMEQQRESKPSRIHRTGVLSCVVPTRLTVQAPVSPTCFLVPGRVMLHLRMPSLHIVVVVGADAQCRQPLATSPDS